MLVNKKWLTQVQLVVKFPSIVVIQRCGSRRKADHIVFMFGFFGIVFGVVFRSIIYRNLLKNEILC